MKRSFLNSRKINSVVSAIVLASLVGCGNAKGQDVTEAEKKLLKTFRSEFVKITPGEGKFPATFQMGSENGPATEQPVKTIEMNREFSIAKYEVYQNLYQYVMGKNPSRWQGARNSAERMTFADATEFCEKITQRLRQTGLIQENQIVCLPTEAEWEYCARAGTATRYSFGDDAQEDGDEGNQASRLDTYAWHTGNAAGNDPEVGFLEPNPWGLYEVHGYLWEYCLDDWTPNHEQQPTNGHDPVVVENSKMVAIRGGSWKDPYPKLTSSSRQSHLKNARDDAIGFRCVLIVDE